MAEKIPYAKNINGRRYILENPDSTALKIQEPKDEEMVRQILDKYEEDRTLPVIEALIAKGVPITGVSAKLDADWFIRKFIEIAMNATKPFDQTMALEKAAKVAGYFNRDTGQAQGVKISFNMTKPADADIQNAEVVPQNDDPIVGRE